jgi:hypothetical protein
MISATRLCITAALVFALPAQAGECGDPDFLFAPHDRLISRFECKNVGRPFVSCRPTTRFALPTTTG